MRKFVLKTAKVVGTHDYRDLRCGSNVNKGKLFYKLPRK
jgi:hypothetical protein